MFRSRISLLLLVTTCAVALFASGCDPKLSGVPGPSAGGGGGGGGSDPPASVQPEARSLAAVLSLQMELLRGSLSQTAEYDSAIAPAPAPRSFTTDCLTVNLTEAIGPEYEVRVDDCVDANGTTFRGGGELLPFATPTGYYFWPYPSAENKIIAQNAENLIFNHTLDNGNLQLTFQRAGNGSVTSVVVSSYLRHGIGEQVLTLTYDDVTISGAHGSWPAYPDSGARIAGNWSDVSGEFEVIFAGGADVTFTIAGIDYIADLSDGSVQLDSN